jgi:hypothetical protein
MKNQYKVAAIVITLIAGIWVSRAYLKNYSNNSEERIAKTIISNDYDSTGVFTGSGIVKYDAVGRVVENIRSNRQLGGSIYKEGLHTDSEQTFISRYTYNDKGGLIKENHFQKGHGYNIFDTQLYTYQYDHEGKPIEERWADSVYETLSFIKRNKYDIDGNKTETVEYMGKDTDGIYLYEYGEHIKTPRITRYFGREFASVEIYDATGKLSIDSSFDTRGYKFLKERGFLHATNKYQYDVHGNVTERENTSWTPGENGDRVTHQFNRKITYRYEYDAQGTWIKKYLNNKTRPCEVREIK